MRSDPGRRTSSCGSGGGPGADVPELLFSGELVSYPGAWSFQLERSCIILVSDEELEALADPDRRLDLSLTHERVEKSLRDVCAEARAKGQRTLIVAFDHFFKQYRPGQDAPRRLTPDMGEYVQRIAEKLVSADAYVGPLQLLFEQEPQRDHV